MKRLVRASSESIDIQTLHQTAVKEIGTRYGSVGKVYDNKDAFLIHMDDIGSYKVFLEGGNIYVDPMEPDEGPDKMRDFNDYVEKLRRIRAISSQMNDSSYSYNA